MQPPPLDPAPPLERPRARWPWRLLAVLSVLVVTAALVVSAYRIGAEGGGGLVEVPIGGSQRVPSELEPLTELFRAIEDQAVDPPDGAVLAEAAIEGLLEALEDPYARFYDPTAYGNVSDQLDGTYSGVGMELQDSPEGLFIVRVFEDAPADRGGVRAGDRIVGVDGANVEDDPIEAVINRIRGEPGTEVELELAREDGDTYTTVLERAEIAIPRLVVETADSGASHVQVRSFSSGLGEELREVIAALPDGGASGVVLDLRGNPGGLLREAVSVAGAFLDEDEVVVRVVERGGEEEVLRASGDSLEDLPLVVLVDGLTASAAEIVAGALQDAGRAQLVGEPTFGKGTVQTIRALSDGSGAKFTTAAYFTPSGTSIEEVGVQPDLDVAADPDAEEDPQLTAALDQLRALLVDRS